MTIRRKIKKAIYKMWFRPKPGNIFYSPTLHWMYSSRALFKKFEGDI